MGEGWCHPLFTNGAHSWEAFWTRGTVWFPLTLKELRQTIL